MFTDELAKGAAIVWTADTDVDCDGIDEHCRVGLSTPLSTADQLLT